MSTKTKTKPEAARPTKIAAAITLLERKEGATLAELTKATCWQEHSVRAVFTGLKKKGHEIVRSKRGGVNVYRIEVSS